MDTPQILREMVWEREIISGILDDMLPLEFNDEDLEFLKEKETQNEDN